MKGGARSGSGRPRKEPTRVMRVAENAQPIDASKVTRFEVIDHRDDGVGRILTCNGVRVTLSPQDDGRTLKVFLNDA